MKEKIAILCFIIFIIVANLLSLFFISLTKDQELVDFFTKDEPLSERYSSREKVHLEEVKELVSIGFLVLFLSMIILSFTYNKKTKKEAVIILLKIVVPLVALTLIAFSFLFTIFHKLAFRTDTWLLPSDSLLISLYPESFFLLATVMLEGLIILEAIIIKKIKEQ